MSDFKELIQQLGKDQETAFKANRELITVLAEASGPGKESARAEAAKQLAEELNAKAPQKEKDKKAAPAFAYSPEVRVKIARLLSYVAGAEAVPALADALKDLDVREMARITLDFDASPDAAKTLLAATAEIGPTFRIGVINALGRRKATEAVNLLQEIAMNDSDDDVRIAAVEALANIPEAGSDSALVKATRSECKCMKTRAWKARVRLAETLRLAGQKDAAAKIYRAIQSGDADAPQKKAAELGLKATA